MAVVAASRRMESRLRREWLACSVARRRAAAWGGFLSVLVIASCAAAPRLDKSVIYAPSLATSGAPIDLRPGPHLFLDEYLIESSSQVVRRVNVPQRDPAIPNPVVTGKDPCKN
jgi:hypothetical protein